MFHQSILQRAALKFMFAYKLASFKSNSVVHVYKWFNLIKWMLITFAAYKQLISTIPYSKVSNVVFLRLLQLHQQSATSRGWLFSLKISTFLLLLLLLLLLKVMIRYCDTWSKGEVTSDQSRVMYGLKSRLPRHIRHSYNEIMILMQRLKVSPYPKITVFRLPSHFLPLPFLTFFFFWAAWPNSPFSNDGWWSVSPTASICHGKDRAERRDFCISSVSPCPREWHLRSI